MFRFSLSWPRIIPDGTGEINPDGLRFYNELIDALVEHEIQPMVTLYHWDLPQTLQDNGGWLNDTTVDAFVDFADLAFKTFGDRVQWWLTINEPLTQVVILGEVDPSVHGAGEYVCAFNFLKAHARAYRLYDKKYRSTQKGKISLSLNGEVAKPASCSQEDIEATNRFIQFRIGWFAHPVFSDEGDFPAVMRETVDRKSAADGYNVSRLPVMTEEDIKEIRGTYDFLGYNYYSTYLVQNGETGPSPSYERDTGAISFFDPSWPKTGKYIMRVYPDGIRIAVNWLHREYGNIPIFITENGVADRNGTLDDYYRIDYYLKHLEKLQQAMGEDGCNVIGFTFWSLLDNFEWNSGYSEKFGIVHVDFDDPERTRTLKRSGEYLKSFLRVMNTDN